MVGDPNTAPSTVDLYGDCDNPEKMESLHASDQTWSVDPNTAKTRRILARIENPEGAFPELDWINSRTGILGESFGMASRSIQALVEDGSMIVIREDAITNDR